MRKKFQVPWPTQMFLGPALFLAASVVLFKPYFECNDDTFKVLFLKGIGIVPTPCEYLIYSNILLGWAYKGLYSCLPGVPWWGLHLLLGLYLFLACACFALGQTRDPLFRPTLLLALLIGAALPFFFLLQFTVCSILAAGGALLLTRSLRRETAPPLPQVLLCAAALFYSFLTRPEGFLLVATSFLPLLVLESRGGKPWPQRLKHAGALLLTLLALCWVLDFQAYRGNPGWREFRAFNAHRTKLLDYSKLRYDEAMAPHFGKAGWTPTDLGMFLSWNFLDEDKFNREAFEKISRGYRQTRLPLPDPGELRSVLPLKPLGVLAFFFLGLLALVPKGGRTPPLLYLASILLIFLGMSAFLKASNWVFFPLVLLAPLLALGETQPAKGPFGRKMAPWALFSCSLLLALIYHSSHRDLVRREAVLRSDLALLAPAKDRLYVAWGSAFPFERFPALGNFEEFRDFPLFSLAVFQRSPAGRAQLERFQALDLMKELCLREDLLLICTREQGALYGAYMKETRGMPIRAEKVFAGESFQVYRLRTPLEQ